jgi:hypothetical protein
MERRISRGRRLDTEGSKDRRNSRSICHGLTRNFTEKTEAETWKEDTAFRAGCVSDGCTHHVGARSKGSNGGVAVGLPHRNSSVFKQAHINQWEVKERIRKRCGVSTSGLTSAA